MESKSQRAWFRYMKGDSEEWHDKAIKAINGGDASRCFLYVVTINENIYKVSKSSMAEIVVKVEN